MRKLSRRGFFKSLGVVPALLIGVEPVVEPKVVEPKKDEPITFHVDKMQIGFPPVSSGSAASRYYSWSTSGSFCYTGYGQWTNTTAFNDLYNTKINVTFKTRKEQLQENLQKLKNEKSGFLAWEKSLENHS